MIKKVAHVRISCVEIGTFVKNFDRVIETSFVMKSINNAIFWFLKLKILEIIIILTFSLKPLLTKTLVNSCCLHNIWIIEASRSIIEALILITFRIIVISLRNHCKYIWRFELSSNIFFNVIVTFVVFKILSQVRILNCVILNSSYIVVLRLNTLF